jgi:hypothetical protein
MTDDLVKRLRADNDESFVETLCGEAADRIEALTAQLESTLKDRAEIMAERDQWIQHAKTAVWSDSEEVKLLTEDNVRLRDALETTSYYNTVGYTDLALDAACAALTGKEPSHD